MIKRNTFMTIFNWPHIINLTCKKQFNKEIVTLNPYRYSSVKKKNPVNVC